MNQDTALAFGLVLLFVLVGGVFAATEMALVSLRETQLGALEKSGSRGAKVAGLARDPNTFLAAVQIGVTVAGFLSAAYGATTLAPDVAPLLEKVGLPESASETVALVVMTLLIAYLSLVFGELVPKRLALQRPGPIALAVAPPLSKFATLMRPVIWLLSKSTNVVVRLLGGNPDAAGDEMTEDELKHLVGHHKDLEADERQILQDVFAATDRSLREVMRPRGEVDFLDTSTTLEQARSVIATTPHSRFPVTRHHSVDDVVGFVHVRDLLSEEAGEAGRADAGRTIAPLVRDITVMPSSGRVLSALTQMREGVHMALVVDEYGGTDGIVTLEDIVEELVGEIRDEYDPAEDGPAGALAARSEGAGDDVHEFDGATPLTDFAEVTGAELEVERYSTVAGLVLEHLQRIPTVGDSVTVDGRVLTVLEMDGRRIARVRVAPE
ncbi:hemolysin family protein [Knoellia subterranea]|uniref:Membrane protein n=1 Tax=Knoellia subterranea KCTC 19937 TaxID=1385521 RepID=A0A0A0JNS2_9MICO|nr:hemolysin family protein [Knoellia subterranea]KGN39035.1 membrane protein [Knoellia subterranea KCTC 19937]